MKLEVHERFALLALLPKEGTYEALGAIRRARETISFTSDEVEFYEIKTVDGKIEWSTAKATEQIAEIPIEKYIMGILRTELSDISSKKKLTEAQMSIFDKFVVIYQG